MAPAVTYKKNYTMRLASILLCLVLLTTWLVSDMFARYSTTADADDAAEVAAFVFEIEDQGTQEACFTIPVTGITTPGDESTYSFIVKNNNRGITAEVEQEYTITMKVNGSMPLVCILTKNAENDSESSLNVVSLSQLEVEGQNAAAQSDAADAQLFRSSVAEQDVYTLNVEWPADENDAKYANGSSLAEVELIIQTVQVD